MQFNSANSYLMWHIKLFTRYKMSNSTKKRKGKKRKRSHKLCCQNSRDLLKWCKRSHRLSSHSQGSTVCQLTHLSAWPLYSVSYDHSRPQVMMNMRIVLSHVKMLQPMDGDETMDQAQRDEVSKTSAPTAMLQLCQSDWTQCSKPGSQCMQIKEITPSQWISNWRHMNSTISVHRQP